MPDPTAIVQTSTPRYSIAASPTDHKPRTEALAAPADIDADTFAVLVDAITAQMLGGGDENGKTGAEAPVGLRPPTMSVSAAAQTLTSLVGKLPTLLGALVGSRDPIKSEEGAATRVTEGVAAASQTDTSAESTRTSAENEPATGVDADLAQRSANAGAWIKSSPFAVLLALLREVLLRMEAYERESSADAVTMQREMTINAGDRGVQKAVELFSTALAATLVTGAIGIASMKKSHDSVKIQTKSNVGNLNSGTQQSVAVAGQHKAAQAYRQPTAELRPARNIDGNAVAQRADGGLDAADLQDDATALTRAVTTEIKTTSPSVNSEAYQLSHAKRMAESQIPANQAMFLTTIGGSVGGLANASGQIAAEMTEAERQLLLNVADTLKRIADGHQDQQMKTHEMRKATTDLVESLLALAASTSSDIIRRI